MIEVKHLTKRYGDKCAVSDLSFSIEKGHIYGFLGPNGAGKSTTMNMMTGCLAASEGEVKIGGYDIFEEPTEAKKLIGYLPEIPPLYIDSTPREYLKFVAEAKGVAKADIPAQIEYACEKTRITDVADRLIKHLSKGYRQRVGFAQALIGNPEVIILDEPTVGLDPMQIIEIRDLISELGKDHTVILSSHILSEVQAVCDVVLIISHGKMVACDTPDNLEKVFTGGGVLEVVTEASLEEAEKIMSGIEKATSVQYESLEGGKTKISSKSGYNIEEDDLYCKDVFFAFCNAGKAILSMSMAKMSLEDVFIELTSGGDAKSVKAGAGEAAAKSGSVKAASEKTSSANDDSAKTASVKADSEKSDSPKNDSAKIGKAEKSSKAAPSAKKSSFKEAVE